MRPNPTLHLTVGLMPGAGPRPVQRMIRGFPLRPISVTPLSARTISPVRRRTNARRSDHGPVWHLFRDLTHGRQVLANHVARRVLS